MKVELTEAMLATLLPSPSGRVEYADRRVPELSLRVTASGVRTWTVRARLPDGKQVRPTIGRYPELGIAAARRRARQVLGDIGRGHDPTANKRKIMMAREQQESEPRVSDRLRQWCDDRERDWSERYAAEVRRLCTKEVIPRLGRRLPREVTRADWVGLADALRKRTPAKAHWVYTLVSSFLNHAEAHGWIDANPLPRRGRDKIAPAVEARARALGDDELVQLWRESAALSAKSRLFVRLSIMTGARVSEVAGIAVGEVDLLRGQWRIPAERAKNDHAITLPLPPLLCRELTAIWPQDHPGLGYRLLGSVAGSALQSPARIKQQVDRRLPVLPAWCWHDLRRSMRSGMSRLGIDKDLAELCLNHRSHRPRLAWVYDRHDYGPAVFEAVTVWQNHIAAILCEGVEKPLDIA